MATVKHRRGPPKVETSSVDRHLDMGLTWWAVGLSAIVAIVIGVPKPSFRIQYEFRAASYQPNAERHFTRCDYWGPRGHFTLRPDNGRCDLVLWSTRFN